MNLPKVSIIVTTYLEKTKPYLDLCMASIADLDYPKELLDVILVGRNGYAPIYPNVATVYPNELEFSNPTGLNFGIEWASADSQYFFILNDDVVLTRTCLSNLVIWANPSVILNPIEMEPSDTPKHSLSSRTFVICEQPFLCMFATLIPRLVYEKIGGFDEKFKTGQDDIDYSWRARQAGVKLNICLNSLVWHYGGTSADTTMNNERRFENIKFFKEKWGCLPPFVSEEDMTAMENNQAKWK